MTGVADIAEAIASLSRPLLLCFDLDGTLCPIVDDPDEAHVPRDVQRSLRMLSRAPRISLAILTGRDASAARRMLRVDGIYRGFEHGRVIVPPGEAPRYAAVTDEGLAKLAAFARWATKDALPAGAELEQKRTSRVLHVRKLSARDRDGAAALLAKATSKARELGLHPRPGRSVLEAELSPGDKGTALRQLARATRARGVVYAGDDTTDVPALRAAVELHGMGLFVRSAERPRRPRGVSHSLQGPEEIAELVQQLARIICEG